MPDPAPAAFNWGTLTQLRAASVATILQPSGVNVLQPLYAKLLLAQQSNAPIFTEVPSRVDKVYVATDGRRYFVPKAEVAKRTNNPSVPDVFIDHQGDTYTLQVTFDLRAHDLIPTDAQPLPLDKFSVNLQSSSGGTAIQLTRVQILPAPDGQTVVVQRLLAQADVDLNEILEIFQADPNAWFEVHADVQYRLQAQQPSSVPSSTGPTAGPISSRTFMRSEMIGTFQPGAAAAAQPAATMGSVALGSATPSAAVLSPAAFRVFKFPPDPLPAPTSVPADLQTTNVLLTTDQKEGLRARYPALNPNNKPIYAKVDPFLAADPDTIWVPAESDYGYFRASVIPNQFYVLPDAFALALDASQGIPAMSVILHRVDGQASGPPEYRVRVRFFVMPWLKAERLENLRGYLRNQRGVAYADLVIGGYNKAVFTPTHVFDQLGSTVVNGVQAPGSQEVDAANGFELVLDCTIEFYTLLATKYLVSPGTGDPLSGGYEGSVTVTIKTQENAALPAEIPVHLKLDTTANHPLLPRLDLSSSSATSGPQAVLVSNPSPIGVTVGKVIPTLLVMDEHMPYACKAREAAPSPLTLDVPPNSDNTKITLAPPPLFPLWSAVAVSFGAVALKLDAANVLNRVHELGVSTDVNSSVHVWSYALQHPDPDKLPPSLTGIHVQIQRGNAVPIDVRLTMPAGEQTVQVGFSFADLVRGVSPAQPTFQYKCINMIAGADSGGWSAWQTNTGSDLEVAPVGL